MISLSDTAAHRVKSYIEKRGKGVGLRLGVKTTGCSGMAYVIEFADEVLKIALTKELKKTEWVEVDMSKNDDKTQASIQ